MKIILVEDNKSLNKLITFRLEKSGHDVYGYTMAAQLIDNYRKINPDLLVIDFSLPDMNGKELVEVLKAMKYDAPFIIVTGHSDIQIAIDLMKLGALDFVVKDESFHDILPAVVQRVSEQISLKNKMKKVQKQLVENEALYRNTVNHIPDPILYYFKDKVFFINQSFENKIAYNLHELNSGKWLEIKQQLRLQKIDAWSEKVKKHEIHPVFESIITSKDGKQINVMVKAIKSMFNEEKANLLLFVDITESKQFESRLMKSIIETEERERIRFARDLHDELGPVLSGIKLYVDLLGANEETDKSHQVLREKISSLIDTAVQTSRNLSGSLIPSVLIDFGVNKAIQGFVDQISSSASPKIIFDSNLTQRMEQNIEITIFRVIKELINNSIKHADCQNIEIQLFFTESKKIKLFYEDDGNGFDFNKVNKENSGIGLKSITNRLNMIQAHSRFETAPGEGFALTASINLNESC
ncbi:MAG: response regulator [Bacteroidales bacterium]|jgi:PAS domain S-box-containing protein|nr:response regulator [Bacteroidales bacterium]